MVVICFFLLCGSAKVMKQDDDGAIRDGVVANNNTVSCPYLSLPRLTLLVQVLASAAQPLRQRVFFCAMMRLQQEGAKPCPVTVVEMSEWESWSPLDTGAVWIEKDGK